MKRLFIEGWRLSPTSYAVVIQHHMLDILSRGTVELFFRDIPFWTPAWKNVMGLLPPQDERRIISLSPPPPGTPVDVSLRMAHPTIVARTDA